MKCHLCLLTFLCMLTLAPAAAQQNASYPLWNGIESGAYPVGFKVINHWDTGRNRFPKYDETGILNEERFLPVQISIWYPSDEPWDPARAMPFETYFHLTEQKNDFESLSPERKERAMDIFFGFATRGAGLELTEEQLSTIAKTATAATQDVDASNGPFPVIITGHDGGVWKAAALGEYLASHGYVVISTGPISQTSSLISGKPQVALQRRIQTFERVREMTAQFDFMDASKIGLLAVNSDGMPALLYQMKNGEANALVSIDGWEGKNNGYGYVSASPYFDTDAFRTPYLEFQQHEQTGRESLQLNHAVFEAIGSPSKQSFVLTDFGHAYLTGNLVAVPDLDERVTGKFRFMFGSILAFYNHYLKGTDTLVMKGDMPEPFFQRAEIISEN